VRHVLKGFTKFQRQIVPSSSCIGNTQRQIEQDAAEKLKLEALGYEMDAFALDAALPMFHDDFLGRTIERCEVAITGDGTPLATYTPYTACGLKTVDSRLQAVRNKGVQSCWNYFPLIHGMFNETGEDGVEKMRELHKTTFAYFENTNVKCVAVADLKFQWAMTGKGGSSEWGYFCTCCDVHASTKGEGQAGGCTRCRDSGKVSTCKHHELSTPAKRRQKTARAAALSHAKPPLHVLPRHRDAEELKGQCKARDIKAGNKTVATLEEDLRGYCSAYVSANIDSECPNHIDKAADKELKFELKKRSMKSARSQDQRRDQLRERLLEEREQELLGFELECTNTSEAAMSVCGGTVANLLPCMLHFEIRVGAAALTSLFQLCLNSFNTTESKRRMAAASAHIREMLGNSDAWDYQLEDGAKKKVKVMNFTRCRVKKIINAATFGDGRLEQLVDLLVGGHGAQAGLTQRDDAVTFFREYTAALEIITDTTVGKRVCHDLEPETMQDHADVACAAYVAWNPRGSGGITNYLHYLQSGHLMELMLLHGPLGRYCNEGVEAFNGAAKQRFFRHTQRGGHKGGTAEQGRAGREGRHQGRGADQVAAQAVVVGSG
jgi:hypothetical protein